MVPPAEPLGEAEVQRAIQLLACFHAELADWHARLSGAMGARLRWHLVLLGLPLAYWRACDGAVGSWGLRAWKVLPLHPDLVVSYHPEEVFS